MTQPTRTAVVTGATSGIGLEAAKALVARGFHVVLVSRNADRLAAARRAILERTPEAIVDTVQADLGVRADIEAAASAIEAKAPRLDVLLNNAGIYNPEFRTTVDGIEETYAVNHLGYAILTDRLLPLLKRSAPARVVSVASHAHRRARFDPVDPEMRRGYQGWIQYCNTKLLNILWTRALTKRLEGTGVTATCCHPGVVATGLARRSGPLDFFFRTFGIKAATGAETPVWLATASPAQWENGGYYARERQARLSAVARDARLAERVWADVEATAGKAAPTAARAPAT